MMRIAPTGEGAYLGSWTLSAASPAPTMSGG